MKNLKKIAALVIVLAMALSSVAFASYSDVAEDASYNEAVQVMSALGLLKGYEDGTFGPDKTITRAEFSAVIVRALGMEDAAAGAAVNTIFPDVPASHWASGYVQIANQQGIVLGYEDGTFGPDDEVLYEQAVTMIERALNYDIKFADDEDAYPTAYLAQANADNITVGATGKIGDKATRAIVARLVYNALDVPMLVQTTIGGIYGDQYAVSTKGETLLTTKLKVAKVEATVGALNFGAEEADEIALNVTKGDLNYDKYVGVEDYTEDTIGSVVIGEGVDVAAMSNFACVAYVDLEDDSEPVLAAIAPKAGKNKTLVLNMKQLESIDVSEGELKYYKNDSNDDKTLKVKIDKTLDAFYNLDAAEMGDDAFEDLPDTEFTALKLIENDGDNSYDVAVVEQYKSFVVESVNERTGTISANGSADKTYGKSRIKLDAEDETMTWSIKDAAGKEIALTDIAKDNVVNIAESTDASANTYYDIIVTNTIVTGTVKELDNDGYYTIGDGQYKLPANSTITVSVGNDGAFIVDMAGNILYKTAVEGGVATDFAFVIGSEVDVEFSTNTYRMSIMNNKGEFSVVELAEKIRYNNDTQKDTKTVFADKDAFKKAVDSKLVAYKLNASGEVAQLYDMANLAKLDASFAVKTSLNDLVYKEDGRIGNYFVTAEQTIMNIDGATAAGATKEDLSLVSVAGLSVDETYDFDTIVYNVNDNSLVVALGLEVKAIAAKDAAAMIVTSTGTTTDANGDPAVLLKGYVNGEAVTVTVTGDTKVQGMDAKSVDHTFAKGDVVQYSADSNGEASGVRIIITAAELQTKDINKVLYAEDETDMEEGFYVYAGTVRQINGRSVLFIDPADRDETKDDVDNGVSITLVGSVPCATVVVNDKYEIRSVKVDAAFNDVATDKAFGIEDNKDKLFVAMYDGAPIMTVIITDGSY